MFKSIKQWIASFFPKKEKVKEAIKKEKPKATRHAKLRFQERHGEILTDDMISSFISDIKGGKVEFLRESTGDTQLFIVTYKNKKYRVVYNYKKETIVTVYSGVKDKKRKPSKKKKVRTPTGRAMKNHSYGNKRKSKKQPYKRNKKVTYEEVA